MSAQQKHRGETEPVTFEEGLKRQKAYAAKRKAWAKAVGRPYTPADDPRPPPGELDAGPDE
ncbi:MAG: hypothetical protein ABI376_10955 [Caulobacteraceae bacterium]